MGRRLITLLLLAVIFALAASQVRFTTDTADVLPSDDVLHETLEGLAEFKSAQMLLLAIDGSDTDREGLKTAVHALHTELSALDEVAAVRSGYTAEDGLAIRKALTPYATALIDAETLAERTSEAGVRAQLEVRLERLRGFGGVFYSQAVASDPLDLQGLATDQLRAKAEVGIRAEDGLLLDLQGTHALMIVTLDFRPADVVPHDARVAALEALLERAPLPVAWFGGHRIAYETASSIERDVRVSAGLGMVLLAGILFLGFRSWRPVVGALLPSAVAAGCVTVGAALASPVHGLQLGFSAALAGLAVDYWVHLYLVAAKLPGQTDRASRYRAALEALDELRPALFVSAGSTALAFMLLTTSSLPIVRVLGITGAAAALGALLGTLIAGPVAWAWIGRPQSNPDSATPPLGIATPLVLGVVVLGLVGTTGHFDPDPMALIAQSPRATADEALLADRFDLSTRRGLILLEEPDPATLLDRAGHIQDAIAELGFVAPLGPTTLIPSPAQVAERRAALPGVATLQRRIDSIAAELGLPEFPGAAGRVYAALASPPREVWRDTPLADRIQIAGNKTLISIPLVDDTVAPAIVDTLQAADPEARLVVPTALATAGLADAREALISRAGLAAFAVFLLLSLRHRDPAKAALAMLPAVAAVGGAAGIVALWGAPWNPVSLAAMVPVLGLAVDYGVFMTEADPRTAPRAVALSAGTTLAGFSTLALAASPALNGVGIATFAGVGIAAVVALGVLPAARKSWPGPRVRRVVVAVAAAVVIGLQLDIGLNIFGAYSPPVPASPAAHTLEVTAGHYQYGDTHLVRDDGLWMMSTQGSPYDSGYGAGRVTAHLRPRLETELFEAFQLHVPNPAFRWLITRGSLVAGMGLESKIELAHRIEIQGTGDAVEEPYWFAGSMYTRKVYYHAIHDFGQALVDSPLLACTAIAAGGKATADGRWLIARNFDFEGGVAFDRDKILRVHQPEQGIPFLAVGFTGMVGAVSGLNAEGIALIINAGGSDDPPRPGTPMTLIVREVLETASSLDEVEAILHARSGFVSENILVVDADAGEGALFEVSPAQVVRVDFDQRIAVSNHFRSPAFMGDKTNRQRIFESTTVQRLARAEELLGRTHGTLTPDSALEILLDRRGVQDFPLPRGHRHALNADIATHGVILDATNRTVWVSRFPNVAGGFVEVRLDDMLAGTLQTRRIRDPDPDASTALGYRTGRALLRRARRSSDTEALGLTERALTLMPGHPEALYERGRVLTALGHADEARPLLERSLAAPPEYAYQIEAIEELLAP